MEGVFPFIGEYRCMLREGFVGVNKVMVGVGFDGV